MKLKKNKIIIEPIEQSKKEKEVNWDKIWAGVKKSRTLKGKGKNITAVEFLIRDRKAH